VPLAWALAFKADMKVPGVFASIPIAEVLITLLGFMMFVKGGWKRKKI